VHRNIELQSYRLKRFSNRYNFYSIPNIDFAQIKDSINGLLSFNHFLSTSLDKDVAMAFCLPSLDVLGMTAILFTILVDPTITSCRFASVSRHSCINAEEEVLFGMGSVFRIGGIERMKNGLWEISMALTCDIDPQLMLLTDYMKTTVGAFSGIPKLAQLLARMGAWNAGREIYAALLSTTDKSNAAEIAHIQNQLGYLAWQKGEFDLALRHFEQSLSNRTNRSSSEVALTYRNIGLVLRDKGEYDKALEYFQDALSTDLAADPVSQEQIVCTEVLSSYKLTISTC
jgi:tetratricopeptide (TPR) repeat protein